MARVKCSHCGRINPQGRDVCEKCGAPMPKVHLRVKTPPGHGNPEVPQFRAGQKVAGRYTVQQLIGRGGMGCIYRVQDNVLGETVALKTLLPQFVKDKVVVERFFNEAKIARRLAHPGIVRVHDIGSADDTVYISMEFLEGRSLRHILDNLPPGDRMPLVDVLRIFDELCAALEYAHRFTIHRDIKPENVMVTTDGGVKLMDFGISKLMANTRLTGASVVMGTPFYMSPEQLRNSRDVDARADIYSVGVMLYEVLTGNLPTGVPKPASQLHAAVPEELDHVIQKCVDPEPDNRYHTVPELRSVLRPLLDRIVERQRTQVRDPGEARAFKARGRRRLLGAVACVLVALCTLGGLTMAEAARQGRLAAVPETSTPVPQQMSPAGSWKVLQTLQLDARAVATARAEEETAAQGALEAGDGFWEESLNLRETGNQERAVAWGLLAIQCYVGAADWQDGMVFVPPGPVLLGAATRTVDGFFIDIYEVTMREYADFCEAKGGVFALPAEAIDRFRQNDSARLPVTGVTYYEALAYAAMRNKYLPTEAQWLRAARGDSNNPYPWGDKLAEENLVVAGSTHLAKVDARSGRDDVAVSGCRGMAGNASEWTCTPVQPSTRAPHVGDALRVRGGNFQSPLAPFADEGFPMAYHARSPLVGFRCVRPVPTTLEGLFQRVHELSSTPETE